MSRIKRDIVVEFWNVGQGDATSITLPSGELILIDVGPKNSTLSQWLRSRPRNAVRDIIITHNDSDHAGALPEIVEELHSSIRRVLILEDRDRSSKTVQTLFQAVFRHAHAGHIDVRRLERPDSSPLVLWQTSGQSMALHLRHPDFVGNASSSSPNDASAIVTLDAGRKIMVVWPGDAPIWRVARTVPPAPEMLFGPHHGAPQDRELKRFLPELKTLAASECFISVGTGNGHNHPNPGYIKKLRDIGCRVTCSQMTLHCDRKTVHNARHLMNTNGYYGLPAPAQGVFCRGHLRMRIDSGALTLVPDEYHDEHLTRLKQLNQAGRRLLCMWKHGSGSAG